MEKEETECQGIDAWQEDKLAQRLAGSRSACFSGYTPGIQWQGEPFHDVRRDRALLNSHKSALDKGIHLSFCNCKLWGCLWAAFTSIWLLITMAVWATVTCLVHQTSVWCILSPRYQPQRSATLCSANYAILCAVRLHQNCPSAITKLRASRRVCQPHQPVTVTPNQKITCWETIIRGDSFKMRHPSFDWKHNQWLFRNFKNWMLELADFSFFI